MARRRRAVEQVSRRRAITDRVIAVLLVVLAASGLMSLLPGRGQQAVARTVCRIGSLGLSTCADATPVLDTTPLGEPRCSILARLDEVLPETRTTTVTVADRLPVTFHRARSGDVIATVGSDETTPLPDLWAGEARATRTVLRGVTVPDHVAWNLPGGQGANELLAALESQDRRAAQQQSALALLTQLFASGGRDVPRPTTTFSQSELNAEILPAPGQFRGELGTAKIERWLALDRDVPAMLARDRTADQTSVVARLTGEIAEQPVTGVLRWTRNSAGQITEVLVAIVSDQSVLPLDPPLDPKNETDPKAAKKPRTTATQTVTYIDVPVKTEAERLLADSWLSDPAGFSLSLDSLLGLKAPAADDRLASWLVRAGTVTSLTTARDVATLNTQILSVELLERRRAELTAGSLVQVQQVAAQAGGAARRVTTDQVCVTE